MTLSIVSTSWIGLDVVNRVHVLDLLGLASSIVSGFSTLSIVLMSWILARVMLLPVSLRGGDGLAGQSLHNAGATHLSHHGARKWGNQKLAKTGLDANLSKNEFHQMNRNSIP